MVDTGRIITAGGIASGMESGFHLLHRAGYKESFIDEVARVMEYSHAYRALRRDRDPALDFDDAMEQQVLLEELGR